MKKSVMADPKEASLALPPFRIVIDDREKGGTRDVLHERAFTFGDVPTVRGHLAQGDYSVEGMEGEVAIERKSPHDLVETLFGHTRLADGSRQPNVERFAYELQRLEQYRHVYVSITGGEELIVAAAREHAQRVYKGTHGRHKYPANAGQVFALCASLSAEFSIPFVIFDNVSKAERAARRDMVAWYRQRLGLSHARKLRRPAI